MARLALLPCKPDLDFHKNLVLSTVNATLTLRVVSLTFSLICAYYQSVSTIECGGHRTLDPAEAGEGNAMEKKSDTQTMLREYIRTMLLAGKQRLHRIKDGARVVQQGEGFGSATSDTEIKADKMLGAFFTETMSRFPGVGKIVCEGSTEMVVSADGPLTVYIDPLDGSLNYASRGDSLGLPYAAVVTVTIDQSSKPSFYDIVAANVLDLRRTPSNDHWEAFYGSLLYRMTTFRGKPCKTHPATKLDLGSMIVIGEMYYPENRARLVRAFEGEKGWLRSPGSAAYEMALVASGNIAAFICDRQKNHELGAAYALVKGAGGVAVDFDGNDLGPRTYDFTKQTPVVLAANEHIAEDVLKRLQR